MSFQQQSSPQEEVEILGYETTKTCRDGFDIGNRDSQTNKI